MTNPNDIAFAEEYQTGATGMKHYPLTKREYFAAMAMQGLLVNFTEHGHYANNNHYPVVSQLAVEQADALITSLNADNGK